MFREVEKRTEHSFSVQLSYLEIYNETLVDLLSPLQDSPQRFTRGMVVMEEPGRGVFIRGLSLHPVHSEEEALSLLFEVSFIAAKTLRFFFLKNYKFVFIFKVYLDSRHRRYNTVKLYEWFQLSIQSYIIIFNYYQFL